MSSVLLEKAQEGDQSAKEQMILDNSGLIWSIVRHFSGRGVEMDDLYQLGCLGFLKAIDGFDQSLGTQFSTYAVPKIAGEIRRFLRDDGTVKVSRTIKEQAARIRAAHARLCAAWGREPSLGEIIAETGLSAEDIAVAEAALAPACSLQRPVGEDGCRLEQMIPGVEIEESIIDAVMLQEAISALDPRQQAVLDMRFFRGMTQEKTAYVLGVSQVQVSRMERKALERLRSMLTEM